MERSRSDDDRQLCPDGLVDQPRHAFSQAWLLGRRRIGSYSTDPVALAVKPSDRRLSKLCITRTSDVKSAFPVILSKEFSTLTFVPSGRGRIGSVRSPLQPAVRL